MNPLFYLGAFALALGILITVHELGHYSVARLCGVKVLRFSVGFGRPLWIRRYGPDQTEWALSVFPLGGYVKMLDEREGEVPEDQLDQAFNRKSVWARMAIVAAGPLANFLLALVAYWALFVAGTTTVVPVVGDVSPQTPAAEAGLESGMELTAIGGEAVRSWDEVNLKLVAAIGASGSLEIDAREEGSSASRSYRAPVENWLVGQDPPAPLATLGIAPWRPDMPAVIGQVMEGEPAAEAGLLAGDRVLSIDDSAVSDWPDLVSRVRARPGQTLSLEVERGGESRTLSLTPRTNRLDDGSEIGYIGAGVAPVDWPQQYQREIRYGPLEAVGQAASRTAEMTLLTFDAVRKMVVGLISPTNLSGPITIARIAGDTARSGLESFINFMAYLSISLGVLNLLPIPVLDGGHLLYYLVEAVRGRPVSERTQAVGLKVGLALVGTLMIMALYFDVMRLW